MLNAGLGTGLLKPPVLDSFTTYDAGTPGNQSFYIITFDPIPANHHIYLRVFQTVGGPIIITDIVLGAGVVSYDSSGDTPLNDGTNYTYTYWTQVGGSSTPPAHSALQQFTAG